MCSKENTLFTSRCFCEQKPEQGEAVSLWIWTQFYWKAASWVCVFAEILTLAQTSSTFTPHLESTSFLQTLQHLWGFVPLSGLVDSKLHLYPYLWKLASLQQVLLLYTVFSLQDFPLLIYTITSFKSISKEIYLLTVNLHHVNIVLPDEAFLS